MVTSFTLYYYRFLRSLCFYMCLSSVILSTGGGVESQHALHMVSQHALQVSRPTPRGEVEGPGRGDVCRPTPKGEVEGSGRGGVVSKPTPRGGVCSSGVCCQGVYSQVCLCSPGSCMETPRWLLLRAVRILLECILVMLMFLSSVPLVYYYLCWMMEKVFKEIINNHKHQAFFFK